MMNVLNGIFIFLVLFLFWRINQYSEQVYLLRKEMKEMRESNQEFLDRVMEIHPKEEQPDEEAVKDA